MPSPYSFGMAQQQGVEFELPSREDPNDPNSPHNKCLVRKLGPQDLIAAGLIDTLDGLTSFVQDNHVAKATTGRPTPSGSAMPTDEEFEKMSDLDALRFLKENRVLIGNSLEVIDRIFELAVIEPKVRRPIVLRDNGQPRLDELGKEIPLPFAARETGIFYTDQVDLEDKQAVMNFAMAGVEGVKPFRKGSKQSVGPVENGSRVRKSSKRDVGTERN